MRSVVSKTVPQNSIQVRGASQRRMKKRKRAGIDLSTELSFAKRMNKKSITQASPPFSGFRTSPRSNQGITTVVFCLFNDKNSHDGTKMISKRRDISAKTVGLSCTHHHEKRKVEIWLVCCVQKSGITPDYLRNNLRMLKQRKERMGRFYSI